MGFSVNLSVVRCLAVPDSKGEDFGRSAPFYFSIIMKKIFTLIFLSVFCLNAINAAVTWKLSDDGILTISGTSMPDYSEKDIPWRSQRDKIKKVIIEKGVTKIGKCAFIDCSALTSVTIPNSVTSIGNSAFYGCSNISSVIIPNSVTSIGSNAFYGCSALTSVTIPNSVTSIGNSAFEGCNGISSIIIPNSITKIGDKAFASCNNLVKLEYNAKNGILSTNPNSLSFPTSIKTITIGNEVEAIPAYFICSNANVNTITLPNSVTSIGNNAFNGCSGISSIIIPKSITDIGDNAFAGCDKLENLEYNAEKAIVSTDPNSLSFPTSIKTITIGNEVEAIPAYFIYGNTNVRTITLPKSVISIGNSAFQNCSRLISINIPNSVTRIEDYTFSGCI